MSFLKRIALVAISALTMLHVLQPVNAQLEPQAGDASSVTLGIYQPPTVEYGTEINAVNTLTGKKHGLVQIYINWANPFSYYSFLIDQINRQMAAGDRPVVMIAWQPTDGKQALGCDRDYNGGIPPTSIINGACDRFITTFAQQIKARPERYLIKFAHEMNNIDVPWATGRFGEPPSTFIAMWRKVKSIFSAQGVNNVEWVWAPIYQSNPNTSQNNPNAYYPGNEYVDWVGVSGYNYYNQLIGAPQPWYSFANIFDGILKDFACRYPKPQMIHEFASVEGPGGSQTKAVWIANAYAQLPNYPFLRAVVWYNELDAANPNADFRVMGSTTRGGVGALPAGSGAWTNAYRSAVSSSVFNSTLPSLQAATPATTDCGVVNPNVKPRVRLPIITVR